MKEITQKEYRELEGIRVLAKKFEEELQWLVLCVSDITGEELDEDNYGLASDFVYSTESVKSHLKKLGLKVSSKKLSPKK